MGVKMSERTNLSKIKSDLECLEGREIGTYLYTALKRSMSPEARQYIDQVAREYYTNNLDDFDCLIYDKIRNVCSVETKSAIAYACFAASKFEKASIFESEDLSGEILSELDKRHLDNAKQSMSEFAGFNYRERMISQLARFRGYSESTAKRDIARSFEEENRLERAYKSYESTKDKIRVLLKMGRKADAAETLRLSGDYSKAAELFAETGNYEMSAFSLIQLGRIDEAISLAREHQSNNALVEAWRKKNRIVDYSLKDRPNRKKAKSLDELFATSESGFLKRVIRRNISPQISNAARERLERIYSREISMIHYGAKDEGGGWTYSESESRELNELHISIENLWKGTDRYDKLAEHTNNQDEKIELYLKAGHTESAMQILRDKVNNLIENGDFTQVKKVKSRMRDIEHDAMKQPERDTSGGRE